LSQPVRSGIAIRGASGTARATASPRTGNDLGEQGAGRCDRVVTTEEARQSGQGRSGRTVCSDGEAVWILGVQSERACRGLDRHGQHSRGRDR
jgi:hypothetical protein